MYLLKKHKLFILFMLVIAGTAVLVNSCKKDNSDTVAYFLTHGRWQLASVTRQRFVGDTLKKTDTLNLACNSPQYYTFTDDGKCTFTNYHCITQNSAGTWQFNQDNLSLLTSLTAQDTAKGVVVTTPAAVFANSQIITLGQYSFVFVTGDISSFYTSKTPRVIVRYGFVHPN